MWKQCAVVLLSIVPALALPITTHAVLEPSVHDQLLELEKEAGSVERAVAGRAERSLERNTASGPAGAIAKLSVPDSAFGTAENPRVPEMFVRTQHAHCPDAQCPKAKMENIGLAAKGYNLLFGNPFSTTPGIDPGFTARGGRKAHAVVDDERSAHVVVVSDRNAPRHSRGGQLCSQGDAVPAKDGGR